MTTLFDSADVNPVDATYKSAATNVDDKNVLEDDYCIDLLDEHHKYSSVEMLKDEGGSKMALDTLHMLYASWSDGKNLLTVQVIKLSRILNNYTAIM